MVDKDFRGGTYQRRICKPQGKTKDSSFMWIFSCEVKRLRINGISGFLSNDEKFHLIWTLALLSFTNASEPFVFAPYGKAHLFIHMSTNDSPWSLIFKRLERIFSSSSSIVTYLEIRSLFELCPSASIWFSLLPTVIHHRKLLYPSINTLWFKALQWKAWVSIKCPRICQKRGEDKRKKASDLTNAIYNVVFITSCWSSVSSWQISFVLSLSFLFSVSIVFVAGCLPKQHEVRVCRNSVILNNA